MSERETGIVVGVDARGSFIQIGEREPSEANVEDVIAVYVAPPLARALAKALYDAADLVEASGGGSARLNEVSRIDTPEEMRVKYGGVLH